MSLGLSFEQNLGRVAKWRWALAPGRQILRKGHLNVEETLPMKEKRKTGRYQKIFGLTSLRQENGL